MKNTREQFTRYADMTDTLRDELIKEFRYSRQMGSDVGHAVTCAAHNVLCRRNYRAWSGKKGSDSFAAAMATLFMAGEITLGDAQDLEISKKLEAQHKAQAQEICNLAPKSLPASGNVSVPLQWVKSVLDFMFAHGAK